MPRVRTFIGVMRPLSLLLALAIVACDSQAPSGQLGLPSSRATPSTTGATPAPSGSAGRSASPAASSSASPSASASPSGSPVPAKLLAASATQFVLTVRYGAAMRAATACGAVGQPSAMEGAIDRVASYASSDDAVNEALKTTMSVTVDAGCSAVTFVFAIAAPSGTFTLTAKSVTDRGGAPIDPSASTASLTIADEGRPRAVGVTSQGDRIVIQFTEPMRELGVNGVAQLANYRLDGNAIDATGIDCTDSGCRNLALKVRNTLVLGRTYQLVVSNVADRAGLLISPDPTTLTFVAKN